MVLLRNWMAVPFSYSVGDGRRARRQHTWLSSAPFETRWGRFFLIFRHWQDERSLSGKSFVGLDCLLLWGLLLFPMGIGMILASICENIFFALKNRKFQLPAYNSPLCWRIYLMTNSIYFVNFVFCAMITEACFYLLGSLEGYKYDWANTVKPFTLTLTLLSLLWKPDEVLLFDVTSVRSPTSLLHKDFLFRKHPIDMHRPIRDIA